MKLDKNVIEQFQRDGVVLLRNALDPSQLKAYEEAWEWSLANPGPNATGFPPGADNSFQDACHPKLIDAYEPILREGPLGPYAQQLWGGSPVWFFYEQVFLKGEKNAASTHWHQDTSYWSVNGLHLIAFWITFDSVAQGDALEFVRGSYRQTLFNTSLPNEEDPTKPLFDVPVHHPGYLPRMPDIEANRDSIDIISYATEPGDVIAFHTSTLHGGGVTSDATPSRRTLTLRFFGEDCRAVHSPGPAGPFGKEMKTLAIGERLSNLPRFLKVCDAV